MDTDLREAIEYISRDEKTGNYALDVDVVVQGIDNMLGYKESAVGEPSSKETDSAILDAYTTHQLNEYARLNSVSIKILDLHGPGGGHPYVLFTGSFSAIYALFLDFNGVSDSEGDRDTIRSAVDAKTKTSEEG